MLFVFLINQLILWTHNIDSKTTSDLAQLFLCNSLTREIVKIEQYCSKID